MHFMAKNKSIYSNAVLCFLFNLNSRKSKKACIVFDLKYEIDFKNKEPKDILYIKSELNQVSFMALRDWQLLR